MSVWTIEELEAQISAYKAALLSLASGKQTVLELPNGSRRSLTRSDAAEIRSTLTYLDTELSALTDKTAIAGRTFAKQGGGRW